MDEREWLEADGLGGFAMGTMSGVRTRRYHGLLVSALRPPAERMVLVSGLETWVETPLGRFALSTQRYGADVVHPDGHTRLVSSELAPWPRRRYALPGGVEITEEIVVPRGRAVVWVSYRVSSGSAEGVRVSARPLLAVRDFHGLSHENAAARPDPAVEHGRVSFRLYPEAPEIVVIADARYEHGPSWYRDFGYSEERARGLDWREDLLSPGTLSASLAEGPCVLGFTTRTLEPALAADHRSASELHAEAVADERARRTGDSLSRAVDAYLVRRGEGATLIAGYPWFGDWGRDTFIAIRGLCLSSGRLDEAGSVLSEWAGAVSEGMLPNRFPDHGEEPEYNSVDAALWYCVAVREYLALRPGAAERARLEQAVLSIVRGHLAGTRHRIGVDREDGLLAAGVPGQQLTWMDARVDGREITPRIGKPVEVQALWLNALDYARELDGALGPLFVRATRAFAARLPIGGGAGLADVIDDGHVAGAIDRTLRPNQILAVGGLPFAPITGPLAREIVDVVERALWTPMGLRSLARGEPGYAPRYVGGVAERDGVYHQGTVWPWLAGPFVEAWLRVRGSTEEAKAEARARFVEPLIGHLGEAGIGHVSEIADAEPPHTPRGCPFQAWSLGELIRMRALTAPRT